MRRLLNSAAAKRISDRCSEHERCEADECLLPQAMKLIGEDQIVYASDYPHSDGSYPHSLAELRERGDVSETQKRKVLGDNARRLYKLPS